MLHSYDDDDNDPHPHPFRYARVLGIYHADVIHPGNLRGERMDFLWVRWFSYDTSYASGWATRKLDRVKFRSSVDGAFGFLDPDLVIRGCHIIPAFAHGRTQALLGPSNFRDEEGDWKYHYIGR